jgi:LmbE family N-acetylglucosaminyl deacetylase
MDNPDQEKTNERLSDPRAVAVEKAASPDAWEGPQKILVVLAHPDDPEFFCGATLARWAAAGHTIVYWLLTCGDKGTPDRSLMPEDLCRIRHEEQRKAAAVLGVKEVNFLGYPDGYLVPDLNLRKDITRIIRKERPDVMVTCDPQTLYVRETRLNHPDHRAAGHAALDAVYPTARDHLNFIELWKDEGLEPHIVREVWVSGTLQPNVVLDVTDTWETKIRALFEHKSQIGDPQELAERMRERHTDDSTLENPRYEEGFRRLILD